jgi:hypothetical protein
MKKDDGVALDSLQRELAHLREQISFEFGERIAEAIYRFKNDTGLDPDIVVLPMYLRNDPRMPALARAIRIFYFSMFSPLTTVVAFADVEEPLAAAVPPWRGGHG